MQLTIDAIIEHIQQYFFSATSWIENLFKTASFDTLIVAAIGAFAGAIGAQFIAERGRKKKEILTDIRSINSAMMAATTIFNSSVSLKQKHIKPIQDNYDKQLKNFHLYLETIKGNNYDASPIFEFTADFQTIVTLTCPIEMLQKQVFEKSSVDNVSLMVTSALIGAFNTLNSIIDNRNNFINKIKSEKIDQRTLGCLYFGHRQSGGHVDQTYPSHIKGMSDLCDDCIFFSKFLIDELHIYGMRLKKQYGFNAPMVNKIDYAIFQETDLMPAEDNYKQWINMRVKYRKWHEIVRYKVLNALTRK